MEALPALARAQRYGDVRQTDTARCVSQSRCWWFGSAPVCNGPSRAWTRRTRPPCDAGSMRVNAAIGSAQRIGAATRRLDTHLAWLDTLAAMIDRTDVHGLLLGRIVRLLLDAERLSDVAAAAATCLVGRGSGGGQGRLGGRILRRRRAAADSRCGVARATRRLGVPARRRPVRRHVAAAAADIRHVRRR